MYLLDPVNSTLGLIGAAAVPDITDTFTRTAALSGSSTDTGSKMWGGSGWSTDGSDAYDTSKNAAATLDVGSHPVTLKYSIKVPVDVSLEQGIYILWDHTDAGNQGRLTVNTRANGTMHCVLAYFKTGAAQGSSVTKEISTVDFSADYEDVTIGFSGNIVTAYFDADIPGTTMTYDVSTAGDWVATNVIGFRSDNSDPTGNCLCGNLEVYL